MNYIEYNREERDICAHLFRLLLHDQPDWGPLKEFLGINQVGAPQIYCEVALIRDAYHARKPNTQQFLNDLSELIAEQKCVDSYTHFANLPDFIKDPKQTHPKQIHFKLENMGRLNSKGDKVVYGCLQGMFNAKPDLVVCTGSDLFVYEAKYMSTFEREQMERTEQIGEVWAKLLYKDLGFELEPTVLVRTLGLAKTSPDISWERVYRIAENYWGKDDFSLRALSRAL